MKIMSRRNAPRISRISTDGTVSTARSERIVRIFALAAAVTFAIRCTRSRAYDPFVALGRRLFVTAEHFFFVDHSVPEDSKIRTPSIDTIEYLFSVVIIIGDPDGGAAIAMTLNEVLVLERGSRSPVRTRRQAAVCPTNYESARRRGKLLDAGSAPLQRCRQKRERVHDQTFPNSITRHD